MVCVNTATLYASFFCIAVSQPRVLSDQYGWSATDVGLGYIPSGVALIVGSMVGGRFSDWRRARNVKRSPDGKVDPELRLADQIWGVLLCAAGVLLYGWFTQHKIHPAAVLLATAFTGFGMTWVFVTSTAFLTECVPKSTAGVVALGNLLRNPAAAIAAVVIEPLISRMGLGWCFTGLALLDVFYVGSAVLILRVKSPAWRKKRDADQAATAAKIEKSSNLRHQKTTVSTEPVLPQNLGEYQADQENIEYLYNILCALVQLDLWILEMSEAAQEYADWSLFGWQENKRKRIESLLPEEEVDKWRNKGYFQGTYQEEEEVREYVNGFSKEQAMRRLRDLRTLPYISRTFEQMINLYDLRSEQRAHVAKKSEFAVPQRLVTELKLNNETEYIEYVVKQQTSARAMLRSLYNLTIEILRNLANAAPCASIDKASVEALRLKMLEMQRHMGRVSFLLGEPLRTVVFDNDSWW
ncbi:Dityrosine transporter 1 [Schaereria dolodes]|nr:Dityrosine transporter 1 [Schaereria dolodes]